MKKRCLITDKRMFFSREEASKAAGKTTFMSGITRIYKCEFCNGWHLTHKKHKYHA